MLLTIYDYARAQDGLIKKTSALNQNKHLEDAFKSGLEETDTVNYFYGKMHFKITTVQCSVPRTLGRVRSTLQDVIVVCFSLTSYSLRFLSKSDLSLFEDEILTFLEI